MPVTIAGILFSSQFKVDCGMSERNAGPELFLIFGICSGPLQISLNVGLFIKS